jgi:hypothetical protein
MGTVVDLAAVRAARQAGSGRATDQPAAASAAPPLCWRQSQRGNWWTKDARSRLHLVLYETQRGWAGRASTPSGQGRYVDLPPAVSTLAEAKAWAEGWLGMQCIAEAAETRV